MRTSWRKVLKWSSQKVTKVSGDDERLFFSLLLKLRNGWWMSNVDKLYLECSPMKICSARPESRGRGAGPGCICRCRGGSLCWPAPHCRHPSEKRQNTEHASPSHKISIIMGCVLFSNVLTLLSRAEISWPSWLNTDRLKLLWLSAMVISPAALMPTPMG